MTPNLSNYQKAVVLITKEQEKIIGRNLAMQVINQLQSFSMDKENNPVLKDTVNPKDALSELVEKYATIFGQASVEVAKEAVRSGEIGLESNDLPDNLK